MANLRELIADLIRSEDPKTPLTDEEIAGRLGVTRVQVTQARHEAGIPDSRTRLRPHLVAAVRRLIREGVTSDRELTALLHEQGFQVSRFTVGNLRKSLDVQAADAPAEPEPALSREAPAPELRPVAAAKAAEAAEPAMAETRITPPPAQPAHGGEPGHVRPSADPFAGIIGSQGSLKPHVQQAKAAILYPPHGLHTLIYGPSGAGKNELAEAMHRFAVAVRGEGSHIPFVAFNCADYADNPQLLLSQLFGHVKGAYTGADTGKPGLVEKADGGILFLDEVHRLPAEGQEILFHLMDRGEFRRLGEAETHRKATVTLIAATTESPEGALLMTFRRRFPMTIKLPSLAERPLCERMEMVARFVREEAARTRTPVHLTQDAVRAFLLYNCPGNVGQLRSDIQVACARGFLVHISEGTGEIRIDVSELPDAVARGLLNLPQHRSEVDRIVTGDIVIRPSAEMQVRKDDDYSLPGEIYRFIEYRVGELRKAGLADAEINRLLGAELDRQIRRHIKRVQAEPQPVNREDLIRIVGRDVVEAVEAMLERVRSEGLVPDSHLYYCLMMHVSAAVERLLQGKPIAYPHLEDVKTAYSWEFRLGQDMLAVLRERLGISFPEDEAAFLAMYLRGSAPGDEGAREGRVGVVVMTHGTVASGMVDVAGRLLGPNHARWIEMSLDERPEQVLNRVIPVVLDADEGKGVLLLVDMGSLTSFGKIITEQTGIPTRTVSRVDTTMVLEAVRRAALPGASLDQLASDLGEMKGQFPRRVPDRSRRAVVTLCLTGEGTALRLKRLLERLLGDDDVEVLNLSATVGGDVLERLEEISRERKVVAVVGTVNPGHPDIPFIPVEKVLGGEGTTIVRQMLEPEYNLTDLLVEEHLIAGATWRTREEVIDGCAAPLLAGGYVSQAFLTDVYRRELAGATVLEGGVAIPHGSPVYVHRPAIVIATLARPVEWGEESVSIVCLLALGSMGKRTFQQLYRILTPGPVRERLRAASTRDEMAAVLRDAMKAE